MNLSSTKMPSYLIGILDMIQINKLKSNDLSNPYKFTFDDIETKAILELSSRTKSLARKRERNMTAISNGPFYLAGILPLR